MGASYRTPNFVVTAADDQSAQIVANAAEHYRKQHAIDWLGHELPRWAQPCPITVQCGHGMGNGGVTSFRFDNGEVFGWSMSIQGTPDSVVPAVLAHEVLHTVFASHFRQSVPRWADEGACTTVENESEKAKHINAYRQFLSEGRGIPTGKLVTLKEYPPDVMPLYAQGYLMTQFLLHLNGKQAFVAYLADGLRDRDWRRATEAHYGYADLTAFQEDWLHWFKSGMPEPAPVQMAAYQAPCASGNCYDRGSGGFRPATPRPQTPSGIRPADTYLAQPDPQPPSKPLAPTVPAPKGCECDQSKILALIEKQDKRLECLESLVTSLAERQPEKGDGGPKGDTGPAGPQGKPGPAGAACDDSRVDHLESEIESLKEQLAKCCEPKQATDTAAQPVYFEIVPRKQAR